MSDALSISLMVLIVVILYILCEVQSRRER